MLLRTRISLGLTLFFIALVCGLAFLFVEQEARLRHLNATTISVGYRILWNKSIAGDRHDLEMALNGLISSLGPALPAAMLAQNQEELERLLEPVASLLSGEGKIDRLEVIDPTGEFLYNSRALRIRRPTFDSELLEGIPAGDAGLADLIIDSDHKPAHVVARRIGEAGVILLAKSLDSPMGDISSVAGGDSLLVSYYGHCLIGRCQDLWRRLAASPSFRIRADRQVVDLGDAVYSVISTELQRSFSRIATRLYVVNEVTEIHRREIRTRLMALAGLVTLLSGIVFWLWWYLRRAFRPIDDAIGVLNALSQGDTTAQAYAPARRGNDEVGALLRSIDVFRENMLALGRMKRSRAKQRARQERFIRHQMRELARGLDAQGQAEVLADLAAIEASADAPPVTAPQFGGWLADETENSGLGMIVPALRKLSGLVSSQNQRLKELVDELTEALKTKKAYIAMQHDLEVARDIQQKIIPAVFPPFPDRTEFDLHAIMEPAKAVGGDLYDFFFIDKNRLFFLVGDVSDKGVPSALFMAIVRTLFRTVAATDLPLNSVFDRVNAYLVANDVSQMFVTVFACIIDLETGRVCFVDGGHEPPILFRADGSIVVMEKQAGLALGFLEFEYQSHEFTLAPGDGLVLYSDGVNEAMNEARQMFRLERAAEVVKATSDSSNGDAQKIATELVRQVHEHAGTAPQSDDITVLVLRYLGANRDSLVPPAPPTPALSPAPPVPASAPDHAAAP